MQANEIEALLQEGLQNCEITVSGEGANFDILVIGELFSGMRPVQKQQQVYALLNELIADGTIHAVNIRTYTQAEWQARA